MSEELSLPVDNPVLNPDVEADISYKVENSEQQTNLPLTEVSNDSNALCYMNQDNTVSFINNPNVFQTVPNECGGIYYACIGTNNNAANQQDQVLHLIPQTQISNYIVSDKEYSNPNFINNPSILNGSSFYSIPNTNLDVTKYEFDTVVSNVFKSINCIGKQICEICSLEFPSKRTYLKHMSIHENDREFKCTWCKLSYNYEVNLLVHVAIIHSNECAIVNETTQETNYKCAICSCIFSRQKAHQAHCLIHQVDEEMPCEHCSSLFKCKTLLDKHLTEHNTGNVCPDEKLSTNYLKCKACKQMFNNVGNLKKHYVQFHPKIKEQWVENEVTTKIEETITPVIDEIIENSKKRRSSKIASQTIKLYAQGKSKFNLTKHEISKAIKSKRGRPRKTECKSSKNISSCVVCNKTFKTSILLRRHEVTHTGVKEFQCAICKKGFTQKSSVKIHMAIHENDKGFTCPYCLKRFTYEHNMNTHIKVIHRNDNSVSDQLANPGQDTVIGIINVTMPEPEVEILESRAADEVGENNKPDVTLEVVPNVPLTDDAEITQYLWNENQTEHPVIENVTTYQPNQSTDHNYVPSKIVDWDKSHKITENRGILMSENIERVDKETGQIQVHEVIKDQVTGFKRFRCRFCFKIFRKSNDLTRHIRIHSQSRPFQCYMCHKSFRLKSVLKNHFKSHWKLNEYACCVCNKIFNLKQTLKVHQQLHSPSTLKYSCAQCPKRFNTAYHLKYHIRHTHPVAEAETGDLKLETDKAVVKTFIWNDLLNQPEPIPDTDKKGINSGTVAGVGGGAGGGPMFKCNHCGKSYKFKKYLNEHLKDHLSSNKTNICQFCNKSFLTFRSMQQHLRTQHLNRRKFSCSQCPAFFITKASLIRHGLVHSNSKPFACPLCFQRFKAKIYCDRHIQAKKCSKKAKPNNNNNIKGNINRKKSTNPQAGLFNFPIAMHHIDSGLLNNDHSEGGFSTFRLEDLDMNNAQSSNILVTNYVNDFSTFGNSDKYMIVSLDNNNPEGKDHQVNEQNNYFTSNMLIEDPSLVDINRNSGEHVGDTNENMIGLLEGQIGVNPADMGSIYSVHNYAGNMNQQTAEIDYTQSGENIYYYQTTNDINQEYQEPVKGSLADKFPILKASLFSDEDEDTKPPNNQFILPVNVPTGATSFVNSAQQSKFYHGCANCDQQFKDSPSLVQHVRLQHKIRRDFVCNVCHKAFSAKLSLWAHSKTHIESRSFGCFVCIACNQRFISVPSLSRHVRMQHNDNLNLYRCTHCNKVYKTTRELDSHVKQLISEYDALIINQNLVANRNSLTNSSNNNDIIVGGVYGKAKAEMDVDIDKSHFSVLTSSQIDQIASLDMGTEQNLSMKELIKAARITKGFTTNATKSNSPRKKSTIDPSLTYPYSCSICHKGFTRASNSQQHLSVHTKLRPYACTKCNKRFRHRCSLKTHDTMKHNPITKLLRCHLCMKLLRSQVALSNHMKIHVRNYSFFCGLCHKGFETSQEQSDHVRQKHSEKALAKLAIPALPSPVKQTQVRQSPVKLSPMKLSPVKQSPAKPLPAKPSPAKQKLPKLASAKRATVKRTPVKRLAIEETPFELAPFELDRGSFELEPFEFKPMKQTPVRQKPIKQTPIKQTIAKQIPLKQKPLKQTPMRRTPAKRTPVKRKPIEHHIPFELTPYEQPPYEQTPYELTPYELAPFELNPIEQQLQQTPAKPKTELPSMIIGDKFIITPVDLDCQSPKKRNTPVIPKKLFKCLSCSYIFNSKVKYDNHYCARLNALKPEVGGMNTSNRCCDKTFELKSQYLRHMQNTHQQMIQYSCAQCKIMFAQESTFRNHQKSVHHL